MLAKKWMEGHFHSLLTFRVNLAPGIHQQIEFRPKDSIYQPR